MSRVLVDSSVWIDHFRGVASRETALLRRLLRGLDPMAALPAEAALSLDLLIGDLILLEILRGIGDDRQHARTRRILLAFDQVRLGGTGTVLAAVDHDRRLRRLGITVHKAIDCLIAAWCIDENVPLLHADRDFVPLAAHCGLRTI
jgi:predicted nucleic acid-binding protein